MQIITTSLPELATLEHQEPHLLIVIPATDLAQAHRSAELMATRAGETGTILIVEDVDRRGFVAVANSTYRASKSAYFGYTAQDALAGRHWLQLAIKSLNDTQTHLLAFNDGKWHGLLAAFGLVRREWADTNYGGDLFYPGYQQHYADAELTLIARSQEKLGYNPNCVLVEVDWSKDQRPRNPEDRELFESRGDGLFDGLISDSRYTRIFRREEAAS